MALQPDDPGSIKLEAIAWLLLQAVESDLSLVRRSHPWARYRRNYNTESPLVSCERRAKVLPGLVLRQPEGTDEGGMDIATPSVPRSDDAPRSVSGSESAYLQLSRSQAWATTRPRQGWRGAPVGRCALAAGVVVVFLALLANMLNHPGLQSVRTLPVAEKSDVPGAALSNAQPDEVASAGPSAAIAIPNSTPRTEASRPVTTMPERAELTDQEAELSHKAQRFADLRAEQQDMQSQAEQQSDRAGEISQHLDKGDEHTAQPETRMGAQGRHAAGTGHPLIASSPALKSGQKTAALSARELPSVPQRLLLARAALVNRHQRAARGLMEEAQTLITFQPDSASPRLSAATTSQITEALIMLGRGDEAGALQCLNQLIAAIRPTS